MLETRQLDYIEETQMIVSLFKLPKECEDNVIESPYQSKQYNTEANGVGDARVIYSYAKCRYIQWKGNKNFVLLYLSVTKMQSVVVIRSMCFCSHFRLFID